MTNNSTLDSPDMAAHKASEAAYYSSRGIGGAMDYSPGPNATLGRLHSAQALENSEAAYHPSNTPGVIRGRIYRNMFHHDRSADHHKKAAENLKPNLRFEVGDEAYNRRMRAIANHERAAGLHSQLAYKSARKLGMNLDIDRGLRYSIRANPDDPAMKLIYADWIEEHGLDREANDTRKNSHLGGEFIPISQRAIE